ncbi:hypothetical protein PVK06_040530 [Gossypium arboreum]|uniref:Uncharacterized protein n=1 Tax=Gossypium arboreum TaxID=29729 RepID=A0ABR0N6H6_GOSAR|nr:hypothetical protein PVK06_040530 [Gossypium arboreum]
MAGLFCVRSWTVVVSLGDASFFDGIMLGRRLSQFVLDGFRLVFLKICLSVPGVCFDRCFCFMELFDPSVHSAPPAVASTVADGFDTWFFSTKKISVLLDDDDYLLWRQQVLFAIKTYKLQ